MLEKQGLKNVSELTPVDCCKLPIFKDSIKLSNIETEADYVTGKIENFSEQEICCKCCGKLNVSDKGLICLQAFRYYLINRFKKNIRLNIESGCRCIKHNKDEVEKNTPAMNVKLKNPMHLI